MCVNSTAIKIQSLVRGHLARVEAGDQCQEGAGGAAAGSDKKRKGKNIDQEQIFSELNFRSILIFQPFTFLEFCLHIVGLCLVLPDVGKAEAGDAGGDGGH